MIGNLRQEGSLKALFPRVDDPALNAVFLNTAGGLTGGDKMDLSITAGESANVVVSSQAAERAYRAQPGQVARMDVALSADHDARINWLPQETILFDEAALNRRMLIDLTGNAEALVVEPVIFGRVAMGETVRKLHFTDQWQVRRDGKLVFADAVRLQGDALGLMARRAIGDGAGAMATVLLAGPRAAGLVDVALPINAGCSLIAEDVLLFRFLADDGFTLRRDLIPVVETLLGAPLPRVWRL